MDIEREVRSVLDEPAPPPPSEPREDDRRGDGGPHIHVVMPLVIFHEDGAIATGDWRGTVLVLAYNLAAFAVVWRALTDAISLIGSGAFAAVVIGAAAATATIWLLVQIGEATARVWRARRARRAAP